MNITIRQEKKKDYKKVFYLIQDAFKTEILRDPNEPFLVERLRKSKAFIPELSLVAKIDDKIVGHILLTKIKIKNTQQEFDSLALAPVSVLPNFQNKGVGGKLINQAHKVAKALGHTSIILLGHEYYYPKFGYQTSANFNITLPKVPKENCMAIELIENALKGIHGEVVYPKEFYE